MHPEEIFLLVIVVPLFIYNVYGWTKEYLEWRRFKKMREEVRGNDAYHGLHEMQNERLQGTNQKENQER